MEVSEIKRASHGYGLQLNLNFSPIMMAQGSSVPQLKAFKALCWQLALLWDGADVGSNLERPRV